MNTTAVRGAESTTVTFSNDAPWQGAFLPSIHTYSE